MVKYCIPGLFPRAPSHCILGNLPVMASTEVYKVVLSGGGPWGFRLQGGKEFRAPLRIAKITPSSKAQQANIYEGLYVQAINNHPSADLTHSEALNIVKKSGNDLELVLCWKPDSGPSSGAYTTEDISRETHVTRATFKPSSEAPSYATLPRGGQGWKGDVDENFNITYVSEANSRSEWDPNIISNVTRPPEPIKLLTSPESIRSATSVTTESGYIEGRGQKGFEKPQPVGRGARRFDEPSHDSYGYKPPLTSSSIGSEDDFNMANGTESSSQDSGPHYASINRPAMNQFRKQKINAEIEATKEPKPLPKKVPPPPPAKPERRYPNILEQERYKGPSRPAIKRGNKWYKEMFKEMHATAGASSNLSALLANDAAKSGEDQTEEDYHHAPPPPPPSDFIHPMHARPVESMNEEPDYKPSYTSAHVPERPHVSPTHTQQVSPPGGRHQEVNVPTWYQDMLKGENIPTEEPLLYGVHKKQHSYDSGDEVKHRFTGPHAPVHANRPPDYVAPLSRSAADRPLHRTVPTTVTVQQEERSKPPTATSMYESRFRGGQAPVVRSASEELGVKQKPPSDEDLIRKREEEARQRREEEERRREEEERELIRQQQEEKQRREREAEQRRRKLEAEEAARKAAERPQFFAMALYNFDAQNPKELSFRKGDYIIVKRQIDRNWIEGELKGRVGIFPTNYVELRPIDDEEEEAPLESPPSPYVPVEGEARVKYNFKAESAREISVGKGEIVTLTRKVDQNWYEGISREGRKGIVPAAYLEVLREPGLVPKASLSPKGTEQPRRQEQFRQEEVIRKTEMPKVAHMPQQVTEIRKTTTTTTTYDRQEQPTSYGEPIRVTHSGQPQIRGGPSKPQSQVQYISKEPDPSVLPAQVVIDEHELFPLEGERFKAAFSYRPQNDDELPLEEGEEVIVLEKCDDGWFVGHSTRTGLFGTFPGNYVVAL